MGCVSATRGVRKALHSCSGAAARPAPLPDLPLPRPRAATLAQWPAGGHQAHQASTLDSYTACYRAQQGEQRLVKSIVQPRLTVQPPAPHNASYWGGCHAGARAAAPARARRAASPARQPTSRCAVLQLHGPPSASPTAAHIVGGHQLHIPPAPRPPALAPRSQHGARARGWVPVAPHCGGPPAGAPAPGRRHTHAAAAVGKPRRRKGACAQGRQAARAPARPGRINPVTSRASP